MTDEIMGFFKPFIKETHPEKLKKGDVFLVRTGNKKEAYLGKCLKKNRRDYSVKWSQWQQDLVSLLLGYRKSRQKGRLLDLEEGLYHNGAEVHIIDGEKAESKMEERLVLELL